MRARRLRCATIVLAVPIAAALTFAGIALAGAAAATATPALAAVPALPAAGIAIGLAAAGALTALIDPRAGATLGTLRLAASATLGFAIEGLLGLLVVAWLLRRDGASVAVRFRPVSLLIVLGAIVLSRVIGFEPGFVFGIVLALVFLRPSPKHEQRGALIELGYLAAVGVAAWLVYSAIVANAPPSGPLGLLGVETLAGLTIGCLMVLPLLLSPFGELPGAAIWRRSRMVWTGAFTVAMALVVWVVMPLPAAWDAVHTPVIAWVIVLITSTLGAAALWVAVTNPLGRRTDTVPDERAPVAVRGDAKVTHLFMSEPPMRFGENEPPADLASRLQALVDAGRAGEAVTTFQLEGVGLPPQLVEHIKASPLFEHLAKLAQSTVYDAAIAASTSTPSGALLSLTVPTTVLVGVETMPVLERAAPMFAERMPSATLVRVPESRNHALDAPATAVIIAERVGG